MSHLLANHFQRPTQSAWTRDDTSPRLGRSAYHYWRQGRDTYEITKTLRRKGWLVTEAGVANALARFWDKPLPSETNSKGVSLPRVSIPEQDQNEIEAELGTRTCVPA